MKTKNINKRVFDRIENVWKKFYEIYNDVNCSFGAPIRLMNLRKVQADSEEEIVEKRTMQVCADILYYFDEIKNHEEYKSLFNDGRVAYFTFHGEYSETKFMKLTEDMYEYTDEGYLAFVLSVARNICAVDSCINFKK